MLLPCLLDNPHPSRIASGSMQSSLISRRDLLAGIAAGTLLSSRGSLAQTPPAGPPACADASSGRRRLGPVSGTWLADPGLGSRRTCDDLRLAGLKLVFLIVTRAVSLLGFAAPRVMVEGRRDLDAASSARCGRARASWCSFASDVAGPGVAGVARRDAADRAPCRDAAGRDPGHDLALAPRRRPPPVGAPGAPGRARPAAGGPQRAVGGAAAGAGE